MMGDGRSAHWVVILALVLMTTAGVLWMTSGEEAPSPPGATVTLQAFDIDTGEPVTGACFSLEGAGNGACDAAGDGQMTFANPIPPGTYDVGYERTAVGDHLAVGNFELVVSDTADLVLPVAFVAAGDGVPNRAEVAVLPVIAEEGTPIADEQPCFTIHGGSVHGIQEDIAWCGTESFSTLVRTGTFLLTSDSCGDPHTRYLWIAVTAAATIEVPLTGAGCIAA